MTAQERQALWFLLALTALGTGVRVVRGREAPIPPVAADSLAFEAQIRAVDSAAGVSRSQGKGRRKRSASHSRTQESERTGPEEVASSLLDITAVPQIRAEPPAIPSKRPTARGGLVDMDVADRAEIETLPWVGPALAERIVANRERCGPFGSLEGLMRVAGIGKGIAQRLSEHVTFSGRSSASLPAQGGC